VGAKEGNTELLCLLYVNMDGSEKIPLLATGKSEKPRCFKHEKFWP
jgi:hypothetical protein